jgi:hypothetical protein
MASPSLHPKAARNSGMLSKSSVGWCSPTLIRSGSGESSARSPYPEPTAANRVREGEATCEVEYIDVNHTTAASDEYRDAMRRVIGPPVGEHVRNGTYFMAPETVSVEYAEPAMPTWNQRTSTVILRRP